MKKLSATTCLLEEILCKGSTVLSKKGERDLGHGGVKGQGKRRNPLTSRTLGEDSLESRDGQCQPGGGRDGDVVRGHHAPGPNLFPPRGDKG